MTSNRDLRKFQEEGVIKDAFSKLVSRRPGYKTIIERREAVYCQNQSCKRELDGHEKFCPGCGEKIEKKAKTTMCTKCYVILGPNDKFCTSCGEKIR